MNKKDADCSPDINPDAPVGCREHTDMPEDLKEMIIGEKPDLEDIGMEDEPIGEKDAGK